MSDTIKIVLNGVEYPVKALNFRQLKRLMTAFLNRSADPIQAMDQSVDIIAAALETCDPAMTVEKAWELGAKIPDMHIAVNEIAIFSGLVARPVDGETPASGEAQAGQ